MNGLEYGGKTEFSFHQTFEKDGMVYDPMYSNQPVKTSDYIQAYKNMNGGQLKIQS